MVTRVNRLGGFERETEARSIVPRPPDVRPSNQFDAIQLLFECSDLFYYTNAERKLGFMSSRNAPAHGFFTESYETIER